MHTHNHNHSHSIHQPHEYIHSRNKFIAALSLTFVFAAVEVIAGLYSGSLALLSDAGHMVSDTLTLMLAAFAAWIASKPPSKRHTYGLGRAEVIAAWASSLFMLGVATSIIIAAIERFYSVTPVQGGAVIVVATIGFLVNGVVAWILSHAHQTMNTRAAMLHVFSDLLGSVAALVSGVIIFFTDWHLIDPILSIFISVLIFIGSMRLLRETLGVLMEGVPKHIELAEVSEAIKNIRHICAIHDLHIWTLSSGMIALSAHVEISKMQHWNAILIDMHKTLDTLFGIKHVTLQPEVRFSLLKKKET